MEIFINNLVPEMKYALQMQDSPSFDRMIKNALRIEEVMVKKGEITLQNESKGGSSSSKPKWWKNNKNVVNDGVVDTSNVNLKTEAFNLTNGM